MKPALKLRLQNHFDGLRRSAGKAAANWQTYAAVTGSALAMASSTSAQIIYSGTQNITAGPIPDVQFTQFNALKLNLNRDLGSFPGIVNVGPGYASAVNLVPVGPNFSSSLAGIFEIGLGQALGDGYFNASAGVNGGSQFRFLHSTSGGKPNFLMKNLGAGAVISQNAGIFENFFNFVVTQHFPAKGPSSTSGSCGCSGGTSSGTSSPGTVANKAHLNGLIKGKDVVGWAAGQTGFAGFSFSNNGQADYGWVRLSYTTGNNGAPNSITAVDWAYDSNGNPITTGDTGSAVPEPATGPLAVLAAGAIGVAALRRRKKATA